MGNGEPAERRPIGNAAGKAADKALCEWLDGVLTEYACSECRQYCPEGRIRSYGDIGPAERGGWKYERDGTYHDCNNTGEVNGRMILTLQEEIMLPPGYAWQTRDGIRWWIVRNLTRMSDARKNSQL